ncbi:hypothetical protein H7Y29_03095 [Microbacteriaceae bacterium]|nr:hypothetical protein [Candidatus Saccharibacteria bacterium]
MFPEDIVVMKILAYVMLPIGIIACLIAACDLIRARKSRTDVDKKVHVAQALSLAANGMPAVTLGIIGLIVLSTSRFTNLTLVLVIALGVIANASLIALHLRARRAEQRWGDAVIYEDRLWKFLAGN